MLSIQELRSSSQKELLLELQKARKEMVKIRISLKTKHEKDTSKARKEKRMIAQILTLLNEFERGIAPKSVKPSSPKVTEAVAEPATKKTSKASNRSASKKPSSRSASTKNS